jgi:hypothetical protein
MVIEHLLLAAMNHIPEEIVLEFLTLALEPHLHLIEFFILDRTHSFVGPPKPFSWITVSKKWCRILKPLLYQTTVLRSKEQANALARAVKGGSRLGGLIKNLMVEGGFGKHMKVILQATTKLEVLRLSLDFERSSESVTGWVAGLPLVNPKQVVLHQPPTYRTGPYMLSPAENTKPQKALTDAVKHCIENVWSDLVCFSFLNLL